MDSNKLGQFLLTGVPGLELDPDTARRFKALQPGGFILFGRNISPNPDVPLSPEDRIKHAEKLRKLIDDLRDLSDAEPIITIDQEGGRVSRLRLIGNEPPNAQALRDKGEAQYIKQHGKLTGKLLRLFGFNLDLCPVLDISYDDAADNSLKGRCYGRNPQEVVTNAGVFNRSLRGEGILTCGKHFPTYGSADVDPHHELPVIRRTKAELLAEELIPFTALLPELDSMMIGHAYFPEFDPDRPRWPSSLSHNIIQKLLRDQLGFDNGLVMTDDLDMGAILNEVTFEQAIQDAMRAGNDIVMICHRVEMVEQAHKHLAGLPEVVINTAMERVQRAKRRMTPPDKWDINRFLEINDQIQELRVAVLGNEKASVLSVEDGKRSPVELY